MNSSQKNKIEFLNKLYKLPILKNEVIAVVEWEAEIETLETQLHFAEN
jgi:hypothetical protein